MSKDNVCEEYEKISDWFDLHRDKSGVMEKEYIAWIARHIPKEANILDLGCGTGEPLAAYFIKQGHRITGVDGSARMIALCQLRFPKEQWLCADMRTIVLSNVFDVVLAWHSFFHLPMQDQRAMFSIFSRCLKSGGILAFTSGTAEGEVWSNNGGQNLYHASLSAMEYRKLLAQHHFEVALHKTEDLDCGGATVWIARKIVD